MEKIFLNQNEIRREKKAAQKRAAQKKSKKNSFKKVETVKRIYNEIPSSKIIDVYTLGYMSDSESVWNQYNNIGFGGKLILKTEDNVEYVITRHCSYFKEIKIAIYNTIEKVPVAWDDEWRLLSQEKKDLYRSKFENGDYIENCNISYYSKKQYGIKINEIYWELKEMGVQLDYDHCYMDTKDKDFMMYYHEVLKNKMYNDFDDSKSFFYSLEHLYNDKAMIDPKNLALLYITYSKARSFFKQEFFEDLEYKFLVIICDIIPHIIEEDRLSFICNIVNGDITTFDLKIGSEYLEYYLDHFNKNELSLQGLMAIIKHSKWVYTVKKSDFGNNKMHEKYEYFNASYCFEKAKKEFEIKFKRAPKILDVVMFFSNNNNITIAEIINRFNVKTIGRLLKIHSAYNALWINYFYPELNNMSEDIIQRLQDCNDKRIDKWVIAHKKYNKDLLINIINNFYYISSRIDIDKSNVNKIKKILLEMESLKEFEKVQKKYNFSELKCSIENTEIQNGDQLAFVLDANSPRQATIGYDTHCCQHLGSVGESAMIYGMLAENAGFWAIEQKCKIVAQAEIWLGLLDNKEVLVFDNIELANDRDFNLIRETLEKWLEASPYNDIIMGTGHNVLSHGYEFVNGDLVQPECDLVPNPYTDAKECVWLKKECEVQYIKEDKKDE